MVPHAGGVVLPVRARAGAKSSAVAGHHAGMLKVNVTAAPEKGKANRAIVAVLAGALALRKSQIELLSGQSSPEKRFLITGLTIDELRDQIERVISDL